ncbi:MAG: YlmH/Sll1252 family protein [Oscillospiraceae bacterium]|nr:YlmH/Sll1252 family protein [Oscillospiraceae bacterium]
MEQKNYLIGHMEDLADKADKTGCAASRFLTPVEARRIGEYFKFKRVKLLFDGGYKNAERVRAVFLNPEWGEYVRENLITALRIEYRPQDTLGHRDILGALMALGIERDTVGDIISEENRATLICLTEMSEFITENLVKAGRVGVTISAINLDELQAKQDELSIKTDTVASLRLDAVISASFGLSRAKTAELIEAGRVSLDHMPCMQSSKELSEGALVSVRGLGRAKLLEIGGVSRKGRIFVRIGIYG